MSHEDQGQIFITGKTKFHYNAEGELIWISFEYAGYEWRQNITDTAYSGSTGWGDITRTKTLGEVIKQ